MFENPIPSHYANSLRMAVAAHEESSDRVRAIDRVTDELAAQGYARQRTDDDGWVPPSEIARRAARAP